MTPELQVLAINAVALAGAYLVFYPGLREKTMRALALGDVALSVLVLGTVGALYWGSEVRFTLIWFEVNWVVFTLITGAAMELPLFEWFRRKHKIGF
jgi:hypothetical protein